MTMKTANLEGLMLNGWVAKAEGYKLESYRSGFRMINSQNEIIGFVGPKRVTDLWNYNPSTDWCQGGAIFEKMKPKLEYVPTIGWRCALEFIDERQCEIVGAHTALEAVMRCYVESVFGEELPDNII